MKMNRIKFAAAVFTAVFALSGITAFAQGNDNSVQTETIIEDNRTLTPKGNAQLVDDVSDNENLQCITVTARDGNVFYFVQMQRKICVNYLKRISQSHFENIWKQIIKKRKIYVLTAACR